MKITINYDHGLNHVVSSAVSNAITKRFPISLHHGCATFTVPDFPAFLGCMWVGFSECSKRSLGEQIRRKYTVGVLTGDENYYLVWVRYDELSKGIRYGSER